MNKCIQLIVIASYRIAFVINAASTILRSSSGRSARTQIAEGGDLLLIVMLKAFLVALRLRHRKLSIR